jgi:hypothetical protein
MEWWQIVIIIIVSIPILAIVIPGIIFLIAMWIDR